MKITIYGNESSSATSIEILGVTETYDYQKEFYRDLKSWITKNNQPSQGGAKTPLTKVMDFIHKVETVTYSGVITASSLAGAATACAVRDKLASYGNNGGPCGLKVTSNDGTTTTLLDWNTTKQAYMVKLSARTVNQDENVPTQYEVTIQFMRAIQQ